MTTALRTADIWALAENAKRRRDAANVERRGRRATAILTVTRLLSELCGVQMDTHECEVLFPGETGNRSVQREPVVVWQGAQWYGRDDSIRQLLCWREGWPRWRTVGELADLAG